MPLSEAGDTARDRFDPVWPPIPPMLAELEAQCEEGEEAAQDEEWALLVALARIAVILAVLRWMASRRPDSGI